MLRQVISLCKNRKKRAAGMIFLLAFVFFMVGSIPALFTQRDHIRFQEEADVSGIFDGIFFALSAEQEEELSKDNGIRSVGFLSRYGEYAVLGTRISVQIGSMDATALELGRIEATEGHLPEAAGEIALEETWRGRLPKGTEVGSTLYIQTKSGEKTYTLCGFIEAYRDEWGSLTNPLIDALPSALVWEESAPGEVLQTDAAVYFSRLQETVNMSSQLNRLAGELDLESENVYFNELLYDDITVRSNYSIFQLVFLFAIVSGAAAAVYAALSSYLRSWGETMRQWYRDGVTKKGTLRAALASISLLSVAALPPYIALHLLFSVVTAKVLGVSIPTIRTFWAVGLTLAGVLVLTVLLHKRKIEPLYEPPAPAKGKESESGDDGYFAFAAKRAKRGWKRLWGVYIAIAVALGLLLCVHADINDRLGTNFYGGDYSLEATVEDLSKKEKQRIGDFLLTEEKVGLSTGEVGELLALPGIESAKLEYMGRSPSLILGNDKDSAYAQALYAQDIHVYPADIVSAIPEDTWAVSMDAGVFEILILDKNQIAEFYAEYPDLAANDLRLSGAVVFCQPVQDELGQTVCNDLFQRNKDIKFGWLEASGNYEATLSDPSLIEYREDGFIITHVFTELDMADLVWPVDTAKVLVVISEETARSSTLCSLANYLHINLEEGATQEEYYAIRLKLEEMTDEAFGVQLKVSKETRTYDADETKTVRLVQGFVGVSLCVCMLYAFFSIVYDSFAQDRARFRVLRAKDCGKGTFFIIVLQEFLLYWVELISICYAGVFCLQGIYFRQVLYEYLTFWNELPYLFRTVNGEMGTFAAATFILFLFAAKLFTQVLWEESDPFFEPAMKRKKAEDAAAPAALAEAEKAEDAAAPAALAEAEKTEDTAAPAVLAEAEKAEDAAAPAALAEAEKTEDTAAPAALAEAEKAEDAAAPAALEPGEAISGGN